MSTLNIPVLSDKHACKPNAKTLIRNIKLCDLLCIQSLEMPTTPFGSISDKTPSPAASSWPPALQPAALPRVVFHTEPSHRALGEAQEVK